MDIYSVKDKKITHIEEAEFKLEKDIQELVDENLKELFDLEVVKLQFTIQNVQSIIRARNVNLTRFFH